MGRGKDEVGEKGKGNRRDAERCRDAEEGQGREALLMTAGLARAWGVDDHR